MSLAVAQEGGQPGGHEAEECDHHGQRAAVPGAEDGQGAGAQGRCLPQQADHLRRPADGLRHVRVRRRQQHGAQRPQRLPHSATR